MDSQTHSTSLTPSEKVLAILPGLVYALSRGWWYLWPADSLILNWGIAAMTLAVVVVYVVLAIRARRLTDWMIMGSGMLVVLLVSVSTIVVSQIIPPPAGHISILSVRKVSAAVASLSVMVIPAALLVWGGLLVQRGRGPIGLLPLASFLFLMQQEIIDPTYAWLIWLPEWMPLAALVIAIVMAPLVIGMPLLTARAHTRRGGYLALLGMGLLAAELSTFAGLIRAFAMQGQVANVPTIGATLLRMLTVSQVFVILPVIVLGGIAALYTWHENRPPPTEPAPATLAP